MAVSAEAAVVYVLEVAAAAAAVVAVCALAAVGAAVVAVEVVVAAADVDRTSVSSTTSRFLAGSTTAWGSIASAITAATKFTSVFWPRK